MDGAVVGRGERGRRIMSGGIDPREGVVGNRAARPAFLYRIESEARDLHRMIASFGNLPTYPVAIGSADRFAARVAPRREARTFHNQSAGFGVEVGMAARRGDFAAGGQAVGSDRQPEPRRPFPLRSEEHT